MQIFSSNKLRGMAEKGILFGKYMIKQNEKTILSTQLFKMENIKCMKINEQDTTFTRLLSFLCQT